MSILYIQKVLYMIYFIYCEVYIMKNNIDQILKSQKKTRYWLAKEVNTTYPTIMRICNNESESIKLSTIENMCKALNCTLNDLFTLE